MLGNAINGHNSSLRDKINSDRALAAIEKQDYDTAKKLANQIFNGSYGKQVDPGMAGSLLYHMAMVTKMESETKVILEELNLNQPNVSKQLNQIYGDFETDAEELLKGTLPLKLAKNEVATCERLTSNRKLTSS